MCHVTIVLLQKFMKLTVRSSLRLVETEFPQKLMSQE